MMRVEPFVMLIRINVKPTNQYIESKQKSVSFLSLFDAMLGSLNSQAKQLHAMQTPVLKNRTKKNSAITKNCKQGLFAQRGSLAVRDYI